MVAVLFVVMTVAVLSVAYLQLSLAKNREGRSAVDSKRSFYIAEAGLSESFTALKLGRSGNVGTAQEPARFAHGVYWVEATEQEDQTVLVRSTGLCGTGRTSLAVVVDRTAESIPGLGVFGDQDVVIGAGALVDGYDSRVGTYLEQEFDPDRDVRWKESALAEGDAGGKVEGMPGGDADGNTPDEDVVEWYREKSLADIVVNVLDAGIDPAFLPNAGRVSTNGDVQIAAGPSGNPTMVLADIQPGPNGTVLADADAVLSGSTVPAREAITLPTVEIPTLTSRGDMTHSGGRPFIVPIGEGSYGTLHVTAGSTLVLKGPLDLVVDELIVDPGATLILNTDEGGIDLFVTGYFGLEPGSLMGEGSKRPDMASIIVTGEPEDRDGDGHDDQPVTLGAAGELHAMLYAPQAELVLHENLELFGSIAGGSVELEANAKVHFDVAVAAVVADALAFVRMRAWRFIPNPDAPIVNSPLDPVVYLKLNGLPSVPSADAWVDQILDITYACADGHRHRYQGPEHLFEPKHVVVGMSSTTAPVPPRIPLTPPVNDFTNPIYGHAEPGSTSPFVVLGTGGA
jgi:hypothetical protein